MEKRGARVVRTGVWRAFRGQMQWVNANAKQKHPLVLFLLKGPAECLLYKLEFARKRDRLLKNSCTSTRKPSAVKFGSEGRGRRPFSQREGLK